MRYTKNDLTTAIREGNIALVRQISLEKGSNKCATKVALEAQGHLWDGSFAKSYICGTWRSSSDSHSHKLSDEW